MLKKTANIFSKVFVSLLAILAILLAGVRLAGLQPFAVTSGSMSPSYSVGSLIYVKPIAPEIIKVGDPITFTLNEELIVATHRVIEIDVENKHFYTKGDANKSADGSPVHFNNLIGKPVFCIPLLGYFSNYVSNPPGLYIAIAIAIALILLAFIPAIVKKKKQDYQKDKEPKTTGKSNWSKVTDRFTP